MNEEIKQVYMLSKGVKITDVDLFLSSHTSIVAAHPGKKAYLPYHERLMKFKKHMDEEIKQAFRYLAEHRDSLKKHQITFINGLITYYNKYRELTPTMQKILFEIHEHTILNLSGNSEL